MFKNIQYYQRVILLGWLGVSAGFAQAESVYYPEVPQAIPTTDCNQVTEIPVSECQSLLELYNSTNGANWTNKTTGWNYTNTPCSWFGITCSGGYVQKIELFDDGSKSYKGNNLNGQIPNLILPNLQVLSLGSNQLNGSIPNFTNLPNLKELYLYSNQLSGNIPNFTNLPNLKQLSLDSNQLTGNIPDLNLPNLIELYLGFNQLSGSIPDFTNLPKLQHLDLSANQLSGKIINFTNLPYLMSLYLYSNQLSGSIPNFTNLSYLKEIYLSSNQLSGNIPNFFNLPYLIVLDLSSNQLKGSIPNFTNFPNLKQLLLALNQLSGKIPNFTSFNLTNLSYIQFSSNCGLIAYDTTQESILNEKDPSWSIRNPICPAPNYGVTLNKSGNGSGTISGEGGFYANATVNLTATPDANSIFTGWSPAPCNSSFQMPAYGLVCTANFTLKQFTLNVNKTGNGQISGGGSFAVNSNVNLSATPDTGWAFNGWSPSVCNSSFQMPANDLTCTANFVQNAYTLTLNKTGNGQISGGGSFTANSNVNLSATPDAGYIFNGWSPSPCNSSFLMPTNNLTCTATFSNCSYQLNTQTTQYNANAATGSMVVSSSNGCTFTAQSNVNWMSITSQNNSVINYSITSNDTQQMREGLISIGSQSIKITQMPNQLPIARFTATPSLNGSAPFILQVDASSSSDPEGSALTYEWKTSNGQAAVGKNAQFVFNQNGAHTITLTVRDQAGLTGVLTQNVNVSETPCTFSLIPTASPVLKAEGETSNFVVNTQPNCRWNAAISGATWITFISSNGDGSGTVNYKVETNPNTQERTGSIIVSGQTFTVKQAGKTPIAPVAQFTASPKLGEIPLQVNLDASKSYDPDDLNRGDLVSYEWIAVRDDGKITFPTQYGKESSFRFDQEGVYLITLKVTDNDGQTAETYQTVNAGVSKLSFNTYRCAISSLNGFEGCQINNEQNPLYQVGSKLKVTLDSQTATNRFERLD